MKLLRTIRAGFAAATRHLPIFRGLGRVVLLVDAALTDRRDLVSYMAVATVNGRCRLLLDLRGREQMFAYYYGRWEDIYIATVERHFQRGVFYDVGASIGLYAMQFGQICRERGTHVRAFEPVPANLDRLRSQFLRNDLSEEFVRIEPVALGETPGTARLTLVDDGRPGNAKITTGGEYVVEVTTLDAVWEDHGREPVGFIKIDTEGWDVRILHGSRRLIETCRPNLLVEFNRERMHNLGIPLEETWQYLVNEMGYTAYRIDDAGREHRLQSPDIWENLLFVASGKMPGNCDATVTAAPITSPVG